MFLKNIKDLNEEINGSIEIYGADDAKRTALKKAMDKTVKRQHNALMPADNDLKASAQRSLKSLAAHKNIEDYHMIRPRDFGYYKTVDSKQQISKFSQLEDYLAVQNSIEQDQLFADTKFVRALDILMNSEILKKGIGKKLQETESQTLKDYIAVLKREGVFEIEITKDDMTFYSVNYKKFDTAFSENWKALNDVIMQGTGDESQRWTLLARQIFLESFIMGEHSDRQLALTQVTLSYLKYEYRKLKLREPQPKDSEQQKILDDIERWYDFSRQKYAFFSDVEKKVFNPEKKWASDVSRMVNYIEQNHTKSDFKTEGNHFYLLEDVNVTQYLKDTLSDPESPWNRLKKLLKNLEDAYHAKSVQNIAKVSELSYDIYFLIEDDHFPVRFLDDHPLVDLIEAVLDDHQMDPEQMDHFYLRTVLLDNFNAKAARVAESQIYYFFTGFAKLRKKVFQLKKELMLSHDFMSELKKLGSQNLTPMEKGLLATYAQALENAQEALKRLSRTKSFFKNFKKFDSEVYFAMQKVAQLLQSHFSLAILRIPGLSREMLRNMNHPQVQERLEISQATFAEYYNDYINALYRSTAIIKKEVKDQFGAKPSKLPELEKDKFDYMMQQIDRRLQELESQKLDIPYLDKEALQYFLKELEQYNPKVKFTGEIIFNPEIYYEFIDHLFKIFSLDQEKGRIQQVPVKHLEIIFSTQKDKDLEILDQLIADPKSRAADFDPYLRIKHNITYLKELVKPFNGSASDMLDIVTKGIARIAVFYAANVGRGGLRTFYIEGVKRKDGSLGLEFALPEQNVRGSRLAWLNLALIEAYIPKKEKRFEIEKTLKLPVINNMVVQSNMARLLRAQVEEVVSIEQKTGWLKLAHYDKSNNERSIINKPMQALDLVMQEQNNYIKQKSEGLFADFVSWINFAKIDFTRRLNFSGMRKGDIDFHPQPAVIKDNKQTPARRIPQITITMPTVKSVATEDRMVNVLTPQKHANFPNMAVIDLNAVKKLLSRQDTEIRLEIDAQAFQFKEPYYKKRLPVTRYQDQRGNEVLRNLMKKDPVKYSVSEDYRYFEVRLNHDDLAAPEFHLSDLRKALKDSGNEEALQEIQDPEKFNEWQQSLGKPFVAVQFIENGQPVTFRACSNPFDTLELIFNGKNPGRFKILLSLSQDSENMVLLLNTDKSEKSDYVFNLVNQRTPGIGHGKYAQRNFNHQKSLEMFMSKRKNGL